MKQIYLFKRAGSKLFDEAVAYCDSFGMRLPVTMDKFVIPQLVELNHGTVWLGITNETSKGTWTNIYTGEKVERTFWADGHPNNDGNHAVLISDGNLQTILKWNETTKDIPHNTICIHGKHAAFLTVNEQIF